MTVLRVIVDAIASPASWEGAYAAELAAALIATAPPGSSVVGYLAASPEEEYERIEARLPGLARLEKSALARRELRLAWRGGLTGRLRGMVHAPGLLAPLRAPSGRAGDQIVVTISAATPWTDPGRHAPREAEWLRAMGRRAARHADAVVVPSHAVSVALDAELGLGDRLRVIPAAPREGTGRGGRAALPDRFVLLSGDEDEDAEPLRRALEEEVALLPLAPEHGPDVVARAEALVVLDEEPGFGLAVLDALAHGVPLVHRDTEALRELAGDAGLAVADGPDAASEAADALRGVLDDATLTDRLRTTGRDRARAHSWRDAGEGVWRLHAEL